MKVLSAAIVAVLTAGVSMTAAAAPAGYVPYKCDNGKKLNVVYEFDRSGNAVGASANAAGKQISLRVDKRQSDSTGTTFTNKRGFSMSAGYIDKNTHTTSEVVGVTDSRNRFIVKNCEPVNIDR